MNLPLQLSKHFREIHFGGNWTSVNLNDTLANVNWHQATTKVKNLNTIAELVFHINYYVSAVLKVLQGSALNAHDKFSFNCPEINSEKDWETLLEKVFNEANQFANLVEQLPESKLWEHFSEEKYGTYYRNIHGIIEHTHYHLGQIAVIKKMILH